jgi:hypothetical protein
MPNTYTYKRYVCQTTVKYSILHCNELHHIIMRNSIENETWSFPSFLKCLCMLMTATVCKDQYHCGIYWNISQTHS